MLGIEDKGVALAYILCIAGAAICVVYGWFNWNKGDNHIKPEDTKWVEHEKQAEEQV